MPAVGLRSEHSTPSSLNSLRGHEKFSSYQGLLRQGRRSRRPPRIFMRPLLARPGRAEEVLERTHRHVLESSPIRERQGVRSPCLGGDRERNSSCRARESWHRDRARGLAGTDRRCRLAIYVSLHVSVRTEKVDTRDRQRLACHSRRGHEARELGNTPNRAKGRDCRRGSCRGRAWLSGGPRGSSARGGRMLTLGDSGARRRGGVRARVPRGVQDDYDRAQRQDHRPDRHNCEEHEGLGAM